LALWIEAYLADIGLTLDLHDSLVCWGWGNESSQCLHNWIINP